MAILSAYQNDVFVGRKTQVDVHTITQVSSLLVLFEMGMMYRFTLPTHTVLNGGSHGHMTFNGACRYGRRVRISFWFEHQNFVLNTSHLGVPYEHKKSHDR